MNKLAEVLIETSPPSIDRETLEFLGKRASAAYIQGGGKETLTTAVSRLIKEADKDLTAEHVRRVCESANNQTHASLFQNRKQASQSIEYPLANSDSVISTLGSTEPASDSPAMNHYFNVEPGKEIKVARADAELARAFGVEDTSGVQVRERIWKTASFEDAVAEVNQHANPIDDLNDLRMQLEDIAAHARSKVAGLRTGFDVSADALYKQLKQACLSGYALGEVVDALSYSHNPDDVKDVISAFSDRLVKEGAVSTADIIPGLAKTAAHRIPDTDHPLVVEFRTFIKMASALQDMEAFRDVATENATKVRKEMLS